MVRRLHRARTVRHLQGALVGPGGAGGKGGGDAADVSGDGVLGLRDDELFATVGGDATGNICTAVTVSMVEHEVWGGSHIQLNTWRMDTRFIAVMRGTYTHRTARMQDMVVSKCLATLGHGTPRVRSYSHNPAVPTSASTLSHRWYSN